MLIYQILPNGYLGEVVESYSLAIPIGFTRTQPPSENIDGKYVVWNPLGRWEYTDIAPE